MHGPWSPSPAVSQGANPANHCSRPAVARRCPGTPRAGQDGPLGWDTAGAPAMPLAALEQRAVDTGGWKAPDSPRTFAAGRGPGIGRGCWRRVTSWAAACLCCLRSVAAGSLSVPPRLSAAGSTAGHQPPARLLRIPRWGSGLGICPPPLCLALPAPKDTLQSSSSRQHSVGLLTALRVRGMPEGNSACGESGNAQPGVPA